MTKIKRYEVDTNVTGSDKWIGSDGNAMNRTKNFTPIGLADFFNRTKQIHTPNALLFKYDTINLGDDRAPGTISFDTEIGSSVDLSSITNFVINKNTINGELSVDYVENMVGNIFMIQKTDESNVFGFYKMISYTQRINEPNFYDVECVFLSGNGSIDEDKYYFVSLLQIGVTGDKYYEHNQSVAAIQWVINHNLGKFPSVTAVLSTGQKGYGDVSYIDENNLTITFAGDETGKAYLN